MSGVSNAAAVAHGQTRRAQRQKSKRIKIDNIMPRGKKKKDKAGKTGNLKQPIVQRLVDLKPPPELNLSVALGSVSRLHFSYEWSASVYLGYILPVLVFFCQLFLCFF